MSEHPKMLYRPHESGPVHHVWGNKCNLLVVEDATAEAAALADGWNVSPPPEGEAWPEAPDPSEFSLLDQSALKIADALPALSPEELTTLLDAERAGKTRKGVVTLLEDAIAAFKPPE